MSSFKSCECGCGNPAPIAKANNKKRGHIKGKPSRFIAGHQNRNVKPYYYDIDPSTGCWNWKYVPNGNNGYGAIYILNKHILPHRLFYSVLKQPIPKGMQLDHLCRNRACVNPDHLETVTQAENIRRGIKTKLKAEQVKEIRARYKNNPVPYSELSALYGVSSHQIGEIIRYNNWRNI